MQNLYLTLQYIAWCGVRREVVSMMDLRTVKYDNVSKRIKYLPPAEKVQNGSVRTLVVPERKFIFIIISHLITFL